MPPKFFFKGLKMDAPKSFTDRLEREFNGRYRIRWSNVRNEWLIEEKLARGVLGSFSAEERNDVFIRMRDGYGLVCTVRTGDRMPCSKCKSELKVSVKEFAEVVCGYCQQQGRSSSIVAGFFPLNDDLIYHLRRINPDTPWHETLLSEVKEQNKQREKQIDREIDKVAQSAWGDNHRQLFQTPTVGYTKNTGKMLVRED